jgi:undecaprenyl-diphosphatase
MVIATVSFGLVLDSVGEHDDLAGWDQPVLAFAVAHRTAALTIFFSAITSIGSGVGLFLVAATVTALVVWRRRSAWPAILVLVTVVGSALINNAVKDVVRRDRPPAVYWLAHPGGFAYPSGHSMNALTAYAVLAFLGCQAVRSFRVRALIGTVAVGLVLAIGASRIYLGVHWFTDVIGGFLAGLVWTALVLAVTTLLRKRPKAIDQPGTT